MVLPSEIPPLPALFFFKVASAYCKAKHLVQMKEKLLLSQIWHSEQAAMEISQLKWIPSPAL